MTSTPDDQRLKSISWVKSLTTMYPLKKWKSKTLLCQSQLIDFIQTSRGR